MGVIFHFLNVGNGDCSIVDFPGRVVESTGERNDARVMMIDIHHHSEEEKYEDVINYYKENFKDKNIFRFICTHPHKDHLKGVKDLFEDSRISIVNFWDLEHDFKPKEEGPDWEDYKEDWEKYLEIQKSENLPGIRRYWDDNKDILYWNEDGIDILSPSRDLHYKAHNKEDGTKKEPHEIDLNNMSYVLLVRVNNFKVLFASDAENVCWDYILENHSEKIENIDVLKAAHHGHESGLHEDALKIMNPKYVIFSNSEERDLENGVEEKYKKLLPKVEIYKTFNGTVVVDVPLSNEIQTINITQ